MERRDDEIRISDPHWSLPFGRGEPMDGCPQVALYFVIRPDRRTGFQCEYEWANQNGREHWCFGSMIVELAQEVGPGQIDSGLLSRLPDRGGGKVCILGVSASPGEGYLAGPRIARVPGTFDEQNFAVGVAKRQQHDCDGRLFSRRITDTNGITPP